MFSPPRMIISLMRPTSSDSRPRGLPGRRSGTSRRERLRVGLRIVQVARGQPGPRISDLTRRRPPGASRRSASTIGSAAPAAIPTDAGTPRRRRGRVRGHLMARLGHAVGLEHRHARSAPRPAPSAPGRARSCRTAEAQPGRRRTAGASIRSSEHLVQRRARRDPRDAGGLEVLAESLRRKPRGTIDRPPPISAAKAEATRPCTWNSGIAHEGDVVGAESGSAPRSPARKPSDFVARAGPAWGGSSCRWCGESRDVVRGSRAQAGPAWRSRRQPCVRRGCGRRRSGRRASGRGGPAEATPGRGRADVRGKRGARRRWG